MTDDEIRAELAKLLRTDDCVSRVGAYRAGMRRAARILREIAADGIPNDSFTISANVLAADIDRAAGGEG